MSERHQHTELWAERLQQVSLPDSGPAWQAMEALLDREMPVKRKNDRRRWFMLILLLLLLIGVCNCPGRGRWFGGPSRRVSSPEAGVPASNPDRGRADAPAGKGDEVPGAKGDEKPVMKGDEVPGAKGNKVPEKKGNKVTRAKGDEKPGAKGDEVPVTKADLEPLTKTDPAPMTKGKPAPPTGNPHVPNSPRAETPVGSRIPAAESHETPKPATGSASRKRKANVPDAPVQTIRHTGSRRIKNAGQYGDIVVTDRHKIKKGKPLPPRDDNGEKLTPAGDSLATKPVPTNDVSKNPATGSNPKDSTRKKPASDGLRKISTGDSLRKKPANDSAQKKPANESLRKKPANDTLRKRQAGDTLRKPSGDSAKKKPEKDDIKGFVAGLGLNQFFPVGGQQVSSFNSDGTTGTLSDYIPVPMIRYYFSRKLYVQLEAQFNAPQYAKKDLVIQATPQTLSPGRVLTNTVSVQKLFYFNLPLSVHFSPVDNLSIGVGLQYSRLRNAVGSIDSTITNTVSTRVDSLVGKHTITLKTSTAYQLISTNEFRVLLDANYTYKHFILGFRYNQALSNFVNVQLGTGTVTQARNSSLQLYLRYILWDNRKKK